MGGSQRHSEAYVPIPGHHEQVGAAGQPPQNDRQERKRTDEEKPEGPFTLGADPVGDGPQKAGAYRHTAGEEQAEDDVQIAPTGEGAG